MPNTSSARKAERQSLKRRLRNRSQKSALRTAIKRARLAIEMCSADAAEAIRLATKMLDQSAAKNLIHKNKAARTKSRLAKLNQRFHAEAMASVAHRGNESRRAQRQDEPSKAIEQKLAIDVQEVKMATRGLRPFGVRSWGDRREKRRFASVAYDGKSKVFTTQWLTDLAFDRVTDVLDDLFADMKNPDGEPIERGQLIVGSSNLDSRSSEDELPYKVLKIIRGQTAMSVIASDQDVQKGEMRTLSLEVAGFAISFSKEPTPHLLTTNVLTNQLQPLNQTLAKSLLLARSVDTAGRPVDLQTRVVAAMRELPRELEQSSKEAMPDTEDEDVADIE